MCQDFPVDLAIMCSPNVLIVTREPTVADHKWLQRQAPVFQMQLALADLHKKVVIHGGAELCSPAPGS